jgi:hypothetical protein
VVGEHGEMKSIPMRDRLSVCSNTKKLKISSKNPKSLNELVQVKGGLSFHRRDQEEKTIITRAKE